MKSRTLVKFAAVVGLVAAMATTANAENLNIWQATLGESGQKTGEVSTEQMRRIIIDNSAIVLDTRTPAEFEAGHIPGARVLDVSQDTQVGEVLNLVGGDKIKALVLYCNGPYCQASRRLADQLAAAGFSNVRRYQLGMPIWRSLGGPTAIELGGVKRVFGQDKTAVFIDVRSADEFAKSSLPGAVNTPVEDVLSGKLKKMALPEDDFNRRVVLFGRNAMQARQFAEVLSKRPWHNIAYFAGAYELLESAVSKN
ncbi:rhodanese-like domain-containing protein [Rhodoplanes sp. Z2-YC6860]|uniref:rhodanese-like domain-containing protein n=1 Tax=Rhodoplanes sp. Z2-YC6860 TaxID=674703 RepID=UPI00078EE270|nr:rhodanese-like domain-containing protein [Rhodoplanes sp. Z2-YC6860]AMN40452.1 sulfur transferase, selenocysteine-containing prote [Rhodoplanes sp. Z2-YC6860]